eukprot:g3050.t1
MDWDFLSFAERWQKDASAYQIAVLVPESVGPTWDYLLTCQRRERPEGTEGMSLGVKQRGGNVGCQHESSHVQDMDFIEYAINQTRCQVSIDDQQIAIMGMSDGASLAMSMALRNPGIFRTALVQATGFFHDTAPDTLKPRVYMEYGTEDKLFGPDTVARPTRDRLRDLGCPVEFAMIDGAGLLNCEWTVLPECPEPAPRPVRLDRWWYVEKALLPAIRRILHSDLVGLPPNLDVTAWLRQVPRPSASSRGAPGPLGRLLRPSCRKCGEKVLCGELCRACASPALRAELQESLQQSRQAAEELWKQCADCAGPLWRSCRAAEFCPVRTRRAEAETELQRLQTLIRELEPPEEPD